MRIGIPDLVSYDPRRGIGRMISTLSVTWQQWGHTVVSIPSRTSHLPVLRNLKWGFQGLQPEVDVIFFGDLLGVESLWFLRETTPSVAVIHDIGAVDCAEDRAEASLLTGPRVHLALLAARRATYLIADSGFTRTRLEHYVSGAANRTEVVHLGVDHHVFRPRDRGQARELVRQTGIAVDDTAFVAIYVGAEYRRKNIVGLIDAFTMLKNRIPEAILFKVGAAHNRIARERTMEAIGRNGLAPGRDVIFIEDVDDSFLADLYCCSDVFVSTSRYEGFGLPLLEALACGLPCVVSNAGSLPEVGGNAALYVDPGDSVGFANRIEEVARSQHGHLAAQALARAAEFDWEKTSRAVLQILQNAVDV